MNKATILDTKSTEKVQIASNVLWMPGVQLYVRKRRLK
jgi:hypothetical protein